MRASRLPFIAIEKAAKGKHSIQRIHEAFGGDFRSSFKERGRTQAKFMWCLQGSAAVPVIKRLIPYLRIKRRVAQIVSKWRPTYGQFCVTGPNGTQSELRQPEVERLVGRTLVTINKHRGVCNGFTVTKTDVGSRGIYAEWQAAKKLPCEPVDGLHPSYIAGFFDAEGHIKNNKSTLYVTISQKDPTIIRTIQERYGGSIYTEKYRESHVLTFCAKSAKAFLLAIRRDVHEKRDQVELALTLSKDNWRDVGPRMKAMRGCQL